MCLICCLYPKLFELVDRLVHRLGHVVQVIGRQTGNGNPAILKQVHVLLLSQELAHVGRQTGETEHADLLRDVTPIAGRSQRLEPLSQSGPHGDDAIGHRLDADAPLGEQSLIVEHGGHDSGAVSRRVRVHAAHDQRHLGADVVDARLVLHVDRQVAGALVVEAEVLGEALGAKEFEAPFEGEVANSSGVFLQIARSETLKHA